MPHTVSPLETALYIHQQKISEIQACSNYLKSVEKSSRPQEADIDQVRDATVRSHKSLQEAENEADKISHIDCPCILLGADRCSRSNRRGPDSSQ
jgi:hypothetical protein